MKNIHILPTDKPSRLIINWEKDLCYKSKPYLMEGTQNIYITSDELIELNNYVVQVNFEKTNTQIIKCQTESQVKIANDKNGSFTKRKIILTTDQDLIKDGIQVINDEFLEWFVKNPSCEKIEVLRYKSNNMHKMNLGYKIIIPKEEPKTAWVGVLHDKLNEYHPAEYELKDIYQGEGCLPNFPNEELCQIWCDSKYKEEPNYNMKQEILAEMEKQETLEEAAEKSFGEIWSTLTTEQSEYLKGYINRQREDAKKWQQKRSYSDDEVKKLMFNFYYDMSHKMNVPENLISENMTNVDVWFETFKNKK